MINKVILIGNLGADVETRYTQSGTQVNNFTVATSEKWKDKDGEWQERTEWNRCVLWGERSVVEYLNKGQQVYVEGKLQTRKWHDQQGNDRYTTEVKIDDVKLIGGVGVNVGVDTGDDVPF